MTKLLAIIVNPYPRPVPTEAIKAAVARAKSWAKFGAGEWFIITDQSPAYWFDQLRPIIGANDNLIVIECNISAWKAFCSQAVLEWLQRDFSAATGI